MALLTTESELTEAGNSVLTASVFHGQAYFMGKRRILASAHAYSALLGTLHFKASAEIKCLHVSGES